jgi:shikimate kinase
VGSSYVLIVFKQQRFQGVFGGESGMKILLTGVSCVGKSTIGKMLADKVGYQFFDFDFEIENYFNRPISFLKREFLTEHSFRKEASVSTDHPTTISFA